LDPDEIDGPTIAEPKLFHGLLDYLTELPPDKREHLITQIIPNLAQRALQLKILKPINGVQFSLQQQGM